MSTLVRIKKEPNWVGDYRIEYDGKYVTLFGSDVNYPGWKMNKDSEDWFEEMVLEGASFEGRNMKPWIDESLEDDKYIYVNVGDNRTSVAWVEPEDLILCPD